MEREFAIVIRTHHDKGAQGRPPSIGFTFFIAKRKTLSTIPSITGKAPREKPLIIDSHEFQEFIKSEQAKRICSHVNRAGFFEMGSAHWVVSPSTTREPHWLINDHYPFENLKPREMEAVSQRGFGAWIDYRTFNYVARESPIKLFRYGSAVSPIRHRRIENRGGKPFGMNQLAEEKEHVRKLLIRKRRIGK
jgi:hypothetical protein